ncbi:hypothetical protein FOXG_20238 [Fusarium oxysporum f. sp. lycopersici 4287]|uniref:Uncharacterized protein n=2 Tax=Fusarium oxysporum TaxID=5507 RepID=A0A0J9WPT8_FUSO4|nr:hypothetical protein FOXG_20238 [Fusarium oxysporum f. sp. lycopersici 4287]EXK27622.1 hypothetical protein FOMG_15856 [Fusarium oxysporum f. sp. melonis 26406]KNB09607.1 hypothetical protein FOXG_20238 [Fusarium oxysporum f. sp. lycopersici 4287]
MESLFPQFLVHVTCAEVRKQVRSQRVSYISFMNKLANVGPPQDGQRVRLEVAKKPL